MRTQATLEAPCAPDVLFGHVDDLGRYPAWMRLVHAATPVEPSDDGAPAWVVELRTQLGPLARSKRLRMVLAEHDPPRVARFERRELDGRRHATWELTASVEAIGEGSRLVMELAYGGSLWTGGILQRVLDDEIGRGRDRLLELVSGSGGRTR